MSEKSGIIKKEIKNSHDINILVDKKTEFFKDIIQKTIIHVQKNKRLDILGISDVSTCIDRLNELSKKINEINNECITSENTDKIINGLQYINNEISGLLKVYGTESLEDLLLICFGNNNKITSNDSEQQKFDLLKKYFHPTSYKVVTKKDETKKKNMLDYDDTINLECSDVSTSYKQLHMKVYGIKLFVNSVLLNKSLIIYGILDDVIVEFLNNKYILTKYQNIITNLPNDGEFKEEAFTRFMNSLILKDYLICEKSIDLYNKFVGYLTQNNIIRQKQISQLVKEFIVDDMYNKRNTLITLLIKSENYENQYLSYLLYDLLSNDTNGSVDSQEQTVLFDSFPWPIKQYFKQAMKKTIQYTNELSNFDINKIPLEQQICLLKANDTVKEKAMMKLKEVKAKSEDSGSKARQYLDGLLKIPFSVYKREPILNVMNIVKSKFKEMYKKYNIEKLFPEIPNKAKYTNIEIMNYLKVIKGDTETTNVSEKIDKIKKYVVIGDKKKIISNIKILDTIKKKHNKLRFKYSNLTKEEMCYRIIDSIETFANDDDETNKPILNDIITEFGSFVNINQKLNNVEIKKDITNICANIKNITDYMSEVKQTMDKAVHGHEKAKKQVEKIISQWINGEQEGYCFGFEGPPGVGKTSLAKRGLSDCLKDENGNSRPFSMIQLGGDSNGSTLHGHNYTYVGSTWGSIVQILIDKKCMNPIILIDEVDKISRTEHGKEIIGILTHLLDPTQNDCFQDKYFTGIELDLSKALFILSYNDVEAIDKILLDRIHRIKFSSLTIEDKLIICKTHILPEVYKKMGLEDMINFSDEVLKFIIDEYTLESGVRKLKEVLFDVVGEINLDMLKNTQTTFEIPLNITINDIKIKYFKDKREIIIRKISEKSEIGYINGMYATTVGNGGTLPIHAKFFPSDKFLELKLTGLQQEVMRESIHVSLTVAWNLTNVNKQIELRQKYDIINNKCGINIHTGDGSVQKDGPSGGCAITCAIYSLLNNIPIKPEFGITGEIQMNGAVTAIGGLNNKIIGSIKADVRSFIFPNENQKDFDEFFEKYKDDKRLVGVKFYPISNVDEALKLILDY